MPINQDLRDRICRALNNVLQPLPAVLAGWEGGSAAFDAVDAYSDIDVTYLVRDDASFEALYASAAQALETVSPITALYTPARGRYYQLKEGGEYLLVDLIFVRAGEPDHFLEVERHGHIIPLFDKGDLQSTIFDAGSSGRNCTSAFLSCRPRGG